MNESPWSSFVSTQGEFSPFSSFFISFLSCYLGAVYYLQISSCFLPEDDKQQVLHRDVGSAQPNSPPLSLTPHPWPKYLRDGHTAALHSSYTMPTFKQLSMHVRTNSSPSKALFPNKQSKQRTNKFIQTSSYTAIFGCGLTSCSPSSYLKFY